MCRIRANQTISHVVLINEFDYVAVGQRHDRFIDVQDQARLRSPQVINELVASLAPEDFARRFSGVRHFRIKVAGHIIRREVARCRPASRAPVDIQRVAPDVERLALAYSFANRRRDYLGFFFPFGHAPRLAPAGPRTGRAFVSEDRRPMMKPHEAEQEEDRERGGGDSEVSRSQSSHKT